MDSDVRWHAITACVFLVVFDDSCNVHILHSKLLVASLELQETETEVVVLR